jgi:hypothetical protein
MGLDIYFHRNLSNIPTTHVTDIEGVHRLTEANDEIAMENLKVFMEKATKRLKKALKKDEDAGIADPVSNTSSAYGKAYIKMLKELSHLYNYIWPLNKVGVKEHYKGGYSITYSVVPLSTFESEMTKLVKAYYLQYDAYFRKVNFLFAYFSPKMVEDCYSSVTLEDVNDLISKCEKVLSNEVKGEDTLPTQDGFFFGSTDYDDYYYYEVKDCLKQMKKFKQILEKSGKDGYVIFSW